MWLASATGVGKTRWMDEGSFCAVQGVSLSGLRIAFLLDKPAGDSSLVISDVATGARGYTYVIFTSDGNRLFSCEVDIAMGTRD